jgi:hypothetical protein
LDQVLNILQGFQPITLEQMDSVALMDRHDTKYVLNRHDFELMLPELSSEYRVLDVNGNRVSKYVSQYFDSSNFEFYRLHQTGKKNRVKIRIRRYVESNINFLEVKLKNNKGRTIKHRMPVGELRSELTSHDNAFIREHTLLDFDLHSALMNSFSRITLVHKTKPERLTFDLELAFKNRSEGNLELPNLVIAELKQEKFDRSSLFPARMKTNLLRPETISKYCLGLALLESNVKKNEIKQKIKKLSTLTDQNLISKLMSA